MRLLRALLLILVATSCGSATAPDSHDYGTRFDDVWFNVDRTYSYFSVKGVDWAAARSTFRPRAASAADEGAYRSVIRDMLATLHDAHVWIVRPDGSTEPTFALTRPVNWDRNTWLAYTTATAGWTSLGNGGHRLLQGVPYIAIGQWSSQFDMTGFDAALEKYRNAPSIIIDVRMNGGGSDALAYQVASRFTSTTRVTEYFKFRSGAGHDDFGALQPKSLSPGGSWQYSGRVVLLIGRGVASSNESFVAAMREIPSVTVAGDTTAGASGNPGFYDLGGGWQYTVSRWVAYTADKQIVEDRGIAPAAYVRWSAADWVAGKDAAIDWAVSFLSR